MLLKGVYKLERKIEKIILGKATASWIVHALDNYAVLEIQKADGTTYNISIPTIDLLTIAIALIQAKQVMDTGKISIEKEQESDDDDEVPILSRRPVGMQTWLDLWKFDTHAAKATQKCDCENCRVDSARPRTTEEELSILVKKLERFKLVKDLLEKSSHIFP